MILDVESSFGAFHKEFSNSGGLITHLIPPKTAIAGMLGAMLGLPFRDTLVAFSRVRSIAVPLGPVRVSRMVYNCHYGGKSNEMNNITQEILVDPRYRIYVELPDDVEVPVASIPAGQIKQLVDGEKVRLLHHILDRVTSKRLHHFPLYMGKNEFFVRYERVDEKLNRVAQPGGMKARARSPVPTCIVATYDATIVPAAATSRPMWGHLVRPRAFAVHVLERVPQAEDQRRDFLRFDNFLMATRGGRLEVTLKDAGLDPYSFYTNAEGELIVLT